MKKIFILMFTLLFFVTGCTQTVEENKITKEEFYSELKYLTNYPEELERYLKLGYVTEDVDFTAKVVSEVETMDFGKENGGSQNYMRIIISKEEERNILLNVSKIKQTFTVGDTINIKGKFLGYLYETINSEKVNTLDIMAEQIEKITPKMCTTTNAQFNIENYLENGIYEFKSAAIVEGTFNNVILLYFDYTNLSENTQYADIGYFRFMQDELKLEMNIFDIETEMTSDILKYESWIEVIPGQTASFYAVLSPDDVTIAVNTTPLKVLQIDDDYNCVNELVLNLNN